MSVDLPAPPSLDELRESGRVALFVDFDGTLVPIARRPDAIEVPDNLAARLAVLSRRMEGRLALVSGRALDDLAMHCGELDVARAGSHGASRLWADGSRLGEAPRALPREAIAAMERFSRDHDLFYEEKAHGGALHYRMVPAARDDTSKFARDLAERHGLAVKAGKGVAEIVWPGADKAGAVHAFMAESPFRGSRPIFIGDDVTDEDGFAAASECGGFGIAVGERRSALAQYHLDSVAAVHQWLSL